MKKLALMMVLTALTSPVMGAVQDTGYGSSGDIFAWSNNGPGSNTTGVWVNPSTVPGLQGAQGTAGTNGTNGTNGVTGATGAKGETGARGAVGPAAPVKAALLTDFELRLFDTRYFSMFAFDSYQLDPTQDHDLLKRAHNNSYGAKFVFKLGRDYTEDRIDALEKKIRRLEALSY